MNEIITKPNILKRIIAGFIDYFIVYSFLFAFIYTFGTPNNEGRYSVTGLLSFIPIIFWFLTIILTETFFGATIGNSIVGLKPISLINNNGKISFSQSIKRHLFDSIEMFMFFGLITIIVIKNSDKNQRLGDIWAKTIVIEVK
jgi:uncharacterized RDD family membrane protein YckC